jgi:hypothetical protein
MTMDVSNIKVLEFVHSLHSSWFKYNLGGDHFCTASLSLRHFTMFQVHITTAI